MPLSIIILLVVLVTIAMRQLLPLRISIWLIMLIGALAVLVTHQIGILTAAKSVNLEVIFYLFGVFVIATALESSGYLEQISDRVFRHAKTGSHVIGLIILVFGLASALLMNDTMAIVGTPIILQLTRHRKELTQPLLLTLAYAVTIGSVCSPIGNPQNLLIAVKSSMEMPFWMFLKVLAIPTFINLIILYGVMQWIFHKTVKAPVEKIAPCKINDHRTALLSKISVSLLIILVMLKIFFELTSIKINIDFSVIALLSALPIILFSPKRFQIVRDVDWGTLIFFVSMFVLMQSVWDSGYFQSFLAKSQINVGTVPSILVISALLSQLVSNVPLVALYLPLLKHIGVDVTHYLALAAGSTLAGNLFIFGAASNIIIILNAERRGHPGLRFSWFSYIGIPLTILNLVVYAVFIEGIIK